MYTEGADPLGLVDFKKKEKNKQEIMEENKDPIEMKRTKTCQSSLYNNQ